MANVSFDDVFDAAMVVGNGVATVWEIGSMAKAVENGETNRAVLFGACAAVQSAVLVGSIINSYESARSKREKMIWEEQCRWARIDDARNKNINDRLDAIDAKLNETIKKGEPLEVALKK